MRGALTLILVAFGAFSCGGRSEPTVEHLDPNQGPVNGEQPVKIVGKNFRTDIGYTVYFGSVRSPSVTILDDKTIIAEAPIEDTPKEVDVTLYADDGSAFRIKQGYRFEIPAKGPTPSDPPKMRY